jgi:hypothetical protein
MSGAVARGTVAYLSRRDSCRVNRLCCAIVGLQLGGIAVMSEGGARRR